MNDFEGRVALVTGAASGIGAATAALLAQRGARVIAADLLAAEQGVNASEHDRIERIALDVSREEDWRQAVSHIVDRHQRLDVLVNAAGIEGNVAEGSLERCSLADFRRVMQVNVEGTFLGCREVMPQMKRQGRGAIVNLSSLAAWYPTLYSVAYGASKAAVMQLSKSVALTGAQGNAQVRCNSVHPGVIATGMIERIGAQLTRGADAAAQAATQQYTQKIPLGAAGSPQQAAELIVFLCSEAAAYITGAEFTVDGGSKLLR